MEQEILVKILKTHRRDPDIQTYIIKLLFPYVKKIDSFGFLSIFLEYKNDIQRLKGIKIILSKIKIIDPKDFVSCLKNIKLEDMIIATIELIKDKIKNL